MNSKVREAIEDIVDQIEMEYGEGDCVRIVREFLSEPLRNCDVGTVEEQIKRWNKLCETYAHCDECPCNADRCITSECFARWAQMPYEKGE